MLYIFSGLPGTGKSELAKFLSKKLRAVYLRIDSIEQAMRDCGITKIDGKGYHVAQHIASDNLKAGLIVISDSVNPFEFTRKDWRNVAIHVGKPYVEIEVTCSCKKEHQRRIESRQSDVPGLMLPNWQDVLSREYHKWTSDHITIDTANKTPDQSKEELLLNIRAYQEQHGQA